MEFGRVEPYWCKGKHPVDDSSLGSPQSSRYLGKDAQKVQVSVGRANPPGEPRLGEDASPYLKQACFFVMTQV